MTFFLQTSFDPLELLGNGLRHIKVYFIGIKNTCAVFDVLGRIKFINSYLFAAEHKIKDLVLLFDHLGFGKLPYFLSVNLHAILLETRLNYKKWGLTAETTPRRSHFSLISLRNYTWAFVPESTLKSFYSSIFLDLIEVDFSIKS